MTEQQREAGDPVVMITGASTGIGLALAHRLLERQAFRLVLTARAASLPRFAEAGLFDSGRVRQIALDVTDPGERREAVRRVNEEWGGVEVLVNNAGVSVRAVVEHVEEADHQRQMAVNYEGPMALARLVLPGMRARRSGRIINVSSVGGMMAMPTMSAYSASKFALEGASESLYYEVRPFGVKVTLVQPGFIDSDGFEHTISTRGAQQSETDERDAYHAHYTHMGRFIARMMRSSPATSDSVARRIERTILRRRPPLRVAGTPDARLFGILRRLLPRRLYHEVLYRSLPGVSEWGEALTPSQRQR